MTEIPLQASIFVMRTRESIRKFRTTIFRMTVRRSHRQWCGEVTQHCFLQIGLTIMYIRQHRTIYRTCLKNIRIKILSSSFWTALFAFLTKVGENYGLVQLWSTFSKVVGLGNAHKCFKLLHILIAKRLAVWWIEHNGESQMR